MYLFLIVCFIAGIAYNIGYNKAHQLKPIYIKYQNIASKNLQKELQVAGISADPSSIEMLTKNLRVSDRVVRKN
jgi:hypothetical protein